MKHSISAILAAFLLCVGLVACNEGDSIPSDGVLGKYDPTLYVMLTKLDITCPQEKKKYKRNVFKKVTLDVSNLKKEQV